RRRDGRAGPRGARGRRRGPDRTLALAPLALAPLVDLLEQQEEHDPTEQAADDGGHPAGAGAGGGGVGGREEDAGDDAVADPEQVVAGRLRRPGRRVVSGSPLRRRVLPYSHSIVPGGLLVMSSTTRLTSRISLIMREAICSSRSYGSRAQSAVIASSDVT